MKQTKEELKAQEQIDKDARIGEFVKSEDWKLIKERLFLKLLEFDSLSIMYEGTKSKSIKALGEKAFVNGKVCSTIINWISEIETEGKNVVENQQLLNDIRQDVIYRRDDDDE